MAKANMQWSMWTVRLLCWSTLWMVAVTGDEVASNAVVKYWEMTLHGGGMPSTIQAMLSPLTSQQTTQLLRDINAYSLPTHAAAFCEVAHIQCGPNITNDPFATSETSSPASDDEQGLFSYGYNKAGPKKLSASDADPGLFSYGYNKAGPEKLSASDADPGLFSYGYNKDGPGKLSASDADPGLFSYGYNKAGPQKLSASDAEPKLFGYSYNKAGPRKLSASNVEPELFGYHYNKAGPGKQSASVDAEPELFGYHYNKAGPGKLSASDADLDLFGYNYNKASPRKLSASDAKPELFGYNYNKADLGKLSTSDAEPELFGYSYNKAVPEKLSASHVEPELFGYHYNKAGPGKQLASDVEPKLFGYHYNKAGPRKLSPSDAKPELFGYHYNKAGPGKLSASDADPELFGYNYNKAGPVKLSASDADPEHFGYSYNKAGPRKLSAFDVEPELFGYHYNKAGPGKLSASDVEPELFGYHYNKAGSGKLSASNVEPELFGYHYNKAGPGKLRASDASLLVGPKPKIKGAGSLMSSTIHEIQGSFFREKQVLVTGFKIHENLATYKSVENDERAFLPRKLAQVFPISNEGVEKISRMLGFTKESLQGTVDRCNARNSMSVEVSTCLASVEDISDFVSSTMGSKKPINAYDSIRNASNVKFTGKTFIVDSVKQLKKDIDEPAITCHDMKFPFRVFYCHYAPKTMIFEVKLKGEDGISHERLAVCHYDTTSWNPEHVSFTELHTKPGETEACHWLGKTWMGQSGWVFSYA